MGVYEINLGKGVILPVEWLKLYLLNNHLKTIKKWYKEQKKKDKNKKGPDGDQMLDRIIKKSFGGDVQIQNLGHDALQIRGGFGIVGEESNEEYVGSLEEIKKHLDYTENKYIEAICEFLWNDFVFIGKSHSLNNDGVGGGTEFNYYVKAPEIIYGIAGLIPQIMKYYPILESKSYIDVRPFISLLKDDLKIIIEGETSEDLEYIVEEAKKGIKECIWTFTNDCHCCG